MEEAASNWISGGGGRHGRRRPPPAPLRAATTAWADWTVWLALQWLTQVSHDATNCSEADCSETVVSYILFNHIIRGKVLIGKVTAKKINKQGFVHLIEMFMTINKHVISQGL